MGRRRTRRNKIQTPPTNNRTKQCNTPAWSKLFETTTKQNPIGQRN